MSVTVIKQHGRPSEPFNPAKLSASLRAACLSAKYPDGLAEELSSSTCQNVQRWCKRKTDITTVDIRAQAGKFLEKNHPDVAYLYKNHKKMM